MLKKLMKQSVIPSEDKGFTLVEMLVSLVIFLFITTFVLHTFILFNGKVKDRGTINKKEWEIFLHQTKSEVWQSTNQHTEPSKLYLVIGSDIVLIEKYQDIIRRRLNNTGHEIMLQNVSGFQTEVKGRLVTITVMDKQGKEYSCVLHPFIIGEDSND
jgi:competence protein ComGF